ncbi:hypothetical protein GYMLUDRAFT_163216, partial [Collybiopsis luxurians FD-317 M1]
SRTNASHMSTKRTELEWKKVWENRSVHGCFAIANHSPPPLKPTQHLKETPRKIFGRLMQCWTGHGYIGGYFSKFVPSKNIDCSRGEPHQTREDILQECPRYEQHRHILRKVSQDLSLEEILRSLEGIDALVSFIGKSGAFTRNGNTCKPSTEPELTLRSCNGNLDEYLNIHLDPNATQRQTGERKS